MDVSHKAVDVKVSLLREDAIKFSRIWRYKANDSGGSSRLVNMEDENILLGDDDAQLLYW